MGKIEFEEYKTKCQDMLVFGLNTNLILTFDYPQPRVIAENRLKFGE